MYNVQRMVCDERITERRDYERNQSGRCAIERRESDYRAQLSCDRRESDFYANVRSAEATHDATRTQGVSSE